jgi:hypothetical protein
MCRLGTFSVLYTYQVRISAAPPYYSPYTCLGKRAKRVCIQRITGKALPKSYLGTGRTWKTYPIYKSSCYPKNMDNIHVTLPNERRLGFATDLVI